MKHETYLNYAVNYSIYETYRSLKNILDPWKVLENFEMFLFSKGGNPVLGLFSTLSKPPSSREVWPSVDTLEKSKIKKNVDNLRGQKWCKKITNSIS